MPDQVKRTNESISDIIRPLYVLYLFSISIASTAPSFKPQAWTVHRLYVVITLICSTAVTWLQIIQISSKHEPALFNITGLLFVNWMSHIVITSWLLLRCKKNKMKKLIEELEELERKLDTIDYPRRVLRFKTKAWVTGLTVYHTAMLIAFMCAKFTPNTWWVDAVYVSTFAFVNLVLDSELVCMVCFASILSSRVEYFAMYLQDLLQRNNTRSKPQLHIVSCFRTTLHVLKRINSVWQTQILMIIVFQYYFTVRSILLIIMESHQFVNITEGIHICLRFLLVLRNVAVFGILGAAGQRLATNFDRVHVLAVTISVSDLPEWALSAGCCMRRVGSVHRGRLRAHDALLLDAALPLRACAALVAAVILAMQLGVNV